MTVQPSSLTVREGTSAKLTCGGVGNPPPSYRWFRLDQGERQEVGRGTDLVVVGSSHTRGHYQCEVRVGDTAVLSSPALLSLYTRPVIQTDQTHYGEAGQDITLTCSVDSGLDDNTISWDVEGLPVSPDNVKYEVRVSRGPQYVSQLTILQAELEDFVSYGCEATNQLGYDYVRIKLLQEGEQFDSTAAPRTANLLFQSKPGWLTRSSGTSSSPSSRSSSSSPCSASASYLAAAGRNQTRS